MPLHNYRDQPWFTPIQGHLKGRHRAIRLRIVETARYVDITAENGPTYSYEFASILRDSCGVVGSVLGGFATNILASKPKNPDANDYLDVLNQEEPGFEAYTVHVSQLRPEGIIHPFWNWSKSKPPKWWTAHNKIKHSEHTNVAFGNLENALSAVAALKILECLVTLDAYADELWDDALRVWNPGDIGTARIKRLFEP